MLVACVLLQVGMVRLGWETGRELMTICVFHVAGLALEIYKVRHGSWFYPEPSITKIAGVPVFSGFMYASVASYIMQAWKRLKLEMVGWPAPAWSIGVVLAIYVNFFTSSVLGDLRWWAAAVVMLVFGRTVVRFETSPGMRRQMPVLLAFLLMGFFVYVGENICSRLGVYVYPHQQAMWAPVSVGKISSWSLLVIFSTLLVQWLKEPRMRPSVISREESSAAAA